MILEESRSQTAAASSDPSTPPDAYTAQLKADQDEANADPPATSHADREIMLLIVHKGDAFPIDNPSSQGAADFQLGDEAEGQAAELEAANTRPDGTVLKDDITKGFRQRAYEARLAGRQIAAAEAVAAAINEEPTAWKMDGDYLRSGASRVYVAKGNACVDIRNRFYPDQTMGCEKQNSQAQASVWVAYRRWQDRQRRSYRPELSTNDPQLLLEPEAKADAECRGGSDDDPKTQVACSHRDDLAKQLQELGWCYGEDVHSEAEATWAQCKASRAKG